MTRRLLLALVAASLSASPALAGGSGAVRRDAGHDREARLARVLAGARRAGATPEALTALERRFEATPGTSQETEDYVYVVPAGDLDGDGLADLLDVRDRLVVRQQLDGSESYESTTRIDARRGRDATLLWTRTFLPDEHVFPLAARVGNAGTPGVLFLSFSFQSQYVNQSLAGAYAAAESLTITAVDGRGTPLWIRPLGGSYGDAYSLFSYTSAESYAYVTDTFDGLPGAATDLLVVAGTSADAAWNSTLREQVLAINGTDGTVVDTRVSTFQQNGYVTALAAPDLDRDGLDEFLTVSGGYGGTPTVAAYRVDTGNRLWSRTAQLSPDVEVVRVGDATGDGAQDFVLQDEFESSTARLVDGASGAELWSRTGFAERLGDLNGDRRAEVAVLDEGVAGDASIRVEAYDAAGRRRWRTTRSLPAPSSGGSSTSPRPVVLKPDSSPYVHRYVGQAGDVTGDGVVDFGYAIVVEVPGTRTRRDEGWIDGRTGRVHRDPAPDLSILRGAVDGHGTESIGLSLSRGTLTVTVYAGSTGKLLWRVAVAMPSGAEYITQVGAATMSKTRCADVHVTVVDGNSYHTLAIGGADGAPLWQLTRDGNAYADATVTRPSARSRTDRNSCR